MKNLTFIFIVVLVACTKQFAHAQYTPRHVEQNQFNFWWDNDVLTMSDRYYSQGLSFQLIHNSLSRNPMNKALVSLGNQANDYYAFSLTQHVITPSTIKDSNLLVNDRPYAGLLYASFERYSINYHKHMQLKSSLDLGMRGPTSGAAQVQYYYHYYSDIAVPLGWHHQMSIYPMVNYNLAFQKQVLNANEWFVADAYGQLRVGTIYNDVLLGGKFNVGKFDPMYKPKLRGNFEAYAFASFDVKYVLYNGTMQGAMQHRPNEYELSPTQIKLWVANLKLGGAIRFKKFELNTSWVYLSPEFKGGMPHSYTSVGMSFWLK